MGAQPILGEGPPAVGPGGRIPSEEWEAARKRVAARREFASHVVAYVVVNAFLVLIWFVTGAGYFWPIWVLGGWAIGLVLHAWEVFGRRLVTEADVEAEVRRQRRRR